MAHDFIVTKGHLSNNQVFKQAQKCSYIKHEELKNLFGGETKIFDVRDNTFSEAKKIVSFGPSNNTAYFWGYAGGLFYDTFNAHKFNKGISGSCEGLHLRGKDAKEKLIKAAEILCINFPQHKDQGLTLLKYAKERIKDAEEITVIFC